MKLNLNLKAIIFLIGILQTFSVKYEPVLQADVLVNTEISKDQSYPSITVLSNGNFVIIWDAEHADHDIVAQVFDDLKKVGDEIKVKETTGNQTMSFVVDLKTKNRMVFLWQDKSSGNISFKMYNYHQKPVNDETIVNSIKSLFELDDANIRVAVSPNGNFFITWQIENSYSDWDVRGRLYDPDGKPLTDDFRVSEANGKDQSRASVCTLTNGNFVVAFHGNQGADFDIYYKIYSPMLTTVIFEETVLSAEADQTYPYCTGLTDGGFVIAYTTRNRNNKIDQAFMIFNQDGKVRTPQKIINIVNADPSISIASLPTDGFAVTYSGIDGNIYYQVFAYDSETVFPEIRLNKSVGNINRLPVISAYGNNDFVIAWEFEYHNDGIRKGIYTNIVRYAGGDCVDLKIFATLVSPNQLYPFQSLPNDFVRITKKPSSGKLIDYSGNELDNQAFYSKGNIYYKTDSNSSDYFYYVNNAGDRPCKVDIAVCYASCQSCTQVGTPQRHNCVGCIESYYPLNDNYTQCYKNTEIITGYAFDLSSSLFKKSDISSTSTTTNTNAVAAPIPDDKSNLFIILGIASVLILIFIVFLVCRRRDALRTGAQNNQSILDSKYTNITSRSSKV
jgi:hypothetical protein